MASNIPESTHRRQPIRAWQEREDGSSVDPPEIEHNNITPLHRQNNIGQPEVHGHAITYQPKSEPSDVGQSRLKTYQPQEKKEIWNDINYFWKLVVPDWNIKNEDLHLSKRDMKEGWLLVLENDQRETLESFLGDLMNENYTLVQEVVSKCSKIRRTHCGILRHQFPELQPLATTWTGKLKEMKNDIHSLKRIVKVFMIMQLQLEESKENLEQNMRKIWNDEYYIWYTVIPVDWNKQFEDLNICEQALRKRWLDVLGKDQIISLQSHLKELSKENISLYQEVVSMSTQMSQTQGFFSHLRFPEKNVILENWGTKYQEVKHNVHGLKRVLEVFMLMQVQLEDFKEYLSKGFSNVLTYKDQGMGPSQSPSDSAMNVSERVEMREEVQTDYMHKKRIQTLERKLKEQVKLTQNEVAKNKKYYEKNFELVTQLAEEGNKMDEVWHNNSLLKEEVDTLKLQAQEREKHVGVLFKENRKQKEELQKFSQYIKKFEQESNNIIKSHEANLARLTANIHKLETDNLTLKIAKEDILTRLSKVAGAKLTHGNADITDLSDENRPTKIAEKFSEIYDNEWTDALEELSVVTSSEAEAIRVNLEIISNAYGFCSQLSQQHADTLMKSLTDLPLLPFEQSDIKKADTNLLEVRVSKEVQKEIEEIRRSLAPQLITVAVKRFTVIAENIVRDCVYPSRSKHGNPDKHVSADHNKMSEKTQLTGYSRDTEKYSVDLATSEDVSQFATPKFNATSRDNMNVESGIMNAADAKARTDTSPGDQSIFIKFPATKVFAEKCANICWLMRIRESKLHMTYEVQRGSNFNSDMYRHYTRTGKRMDYLVWPVLYLYEKGPLLAKGVAQPL